jgi:penicillin-binding protein 2
MLRDIRKNKIFNRRAFFVGASQSVLTAALATRLAYLQLVKHEEYSIKSDSNRIKPLIKPAPRGIIFDRFDQPLTENGGNYRLLYFFDGRSNIDNIVKNLSEILNLSEEEQKIFHQKIKNARRKTIVSLMNNLSWDDVARIESNSHKMPGISIESGIIRKYLYPEETAHFLGYVSLPAENEIDPNEQNLFLHPDFRIGKSGIEKSFDDILRGKYGVKYVEVNAHEIPIRNLSVKQAVDGTKLNLTIDLRLQKFTTERIKNDVASVILMDVKTGEILVYASSPSFDSNRFVEGISKDYWQELNSDIRKPLANKPISATYPPGSTFKLMVALAALKKGINPNKTHYCSGRHQFGRRAFHCWKEEGHGSMDMVNAIKNSCNIYFFNIANEIGIEPIAEMARNFGYGEKFDISLYGAKSGNVPSDEWKRKLFNVPWVGGDTLNTAIGQGFVLATPLQMAVSTARIANGGYAIKPYLVKNREIYQQFERLKNSPNLSDSKYLNLVMEGMNKVINEVGGTAYGKRIEIEGMEMAGKTGTSQVISKRESEMTKAEIAINANQNHAIFVGFAPVSDPKYAISVVVEHGKSGSMAAAPIAKDIMLEAQQLLKKENEVV